MIPPIVIEVILFVVGLLCLVKGGDWFVDGACGIAHRFNMPEILIGATVVSIGTTIPEVMVSSTAALTAGASDMAYGNAIGSIICNTALIAAITMTFRPAEVEKQSLKLPIAFFFAAALSGKAIQAFGTWCIRAEMRCVAAGVLHFRTDSKTQLRGVSCLIT